MKIADAMFAVGWAETNTPKPKRFSTRSAARKLLAALWFTAQEASRREYNDDRRFNHSGKIKSRSPTKG